MPLPSGTLTFLFTDLEGSTKLWEEHPEAMRLALARHDTLLRQAIEDNNGYVFKTVGDAFCAAFATPSVLGVREETGKPLTQTLVEFLKAKHSLLVLDNCEH